ncbi:hypothetical protein AX774_g6332 [Zancudomyces culisetae]|uniref:Uncharacterized protein n=1 Tax=Zancudomyces culisetae TaxID=1213189 RepID=A0A1R1PGY0_ZANCU|nr:hypothetical protein AX774_g6332 [Zancudomyces culisetae]|eukprot:OMH80230.1 hypothetical protein AX774_g6332 [Zancudomyces culisetae]
MSFLRKSKNKEKNASTIRSISEPYSEIDPEENNYKLDSGKMQFVPISIDPRVLSRTSAITSGGQAGSTKKGSSGDNRHEYRGSGASTASLFSNLSASRWNSTSPTSSREQITSRVSSGISEKGNEVNVDRQQDPAVAFAVKISRKQTGEINTGSIL